jgi:hypothetical protein
MKQKRGSATTAYVEKEFQVAIDENLRKGRVLEGIKSFLKDAYRVNNQSLKEDLKCVNDLMQTYIDDNPAASDDMPYAYAKVEDKVRQDERVDLPLEDIVMQDGYFFMNYKVVTEDGYILELHRVWSPDFDDSSVSKPVVFFMHGLLSSSEAFLLNGENG